MTCRSSRLVVAVLSETFSPRMGYIQNALPKFLARLGADVHVLTEDLAPNFQLANFQRVYGNFNAGVQLTPGTVQTIDGFTLHVLGHQKLLGYMRMTGMRHTLRRIRPDIVQAHTAIGWIPLAAPLGKSAIGYKLFTGSHTTAAVLPLAQAPNGTWTAGRARALVLRGLHGRMVSWATEKCYGATVDCADVAIRFFGVQPHKMEVCPLGVDTDHFQPVSTAEDRARRLHMRRKFGFGDLEIVCVYSGRLTADKGPLLLAQAIAELRRRDLAYRGLFLGAGEQANAIAACEGSVVRPFVPFQNLAEYFRAAEIGVWPRQESMSMLDAAACGIPIVVNHTVQATERIEGNGLTYRLDDLQDLIRVLAGLKEPAARGSMGRCGAERMRRRFSWEAIAQRRLRDYQTALRGAGSR